MQLYETLQNDRVLLFFTSLTFWCILNRLFFILISFLKVSRDLPHLIKTYIAESCVSSVQGFLCGGIGVLGILKCRHDVMKAEYDLVVFYCMFGSGYFVYDIFAMFSSNYKNMKQNDEVMGFKTVVSSYISNNSLMIAHHIILITVLFPVLVSYSSMGHFFPSCFFFMELSSPLVNVRVVLSKLNLKRSTVYVVNGVTMMIIFAICRVFIFPYMYLTYCLQVASLKSITIMQALSKVPILCHISCGIVMSPQLYWLSLMVRGVAAVIARKPAIVDKLD